MNEDNIQQNSPKNKASRRWRLILILVIIVIFVAAVGIYQTRGDIYNEMYNFDLIPKSQPFTELYFEHSSALPAQVVENEPISFSFTIHNVEGATDVYPYVVYFEDASGNKLPISDNTVTLADGASTTIGISYTFAPSPTPIVGEVVVNLTSLNQQIDFILQ